ncbi:hypothetical protein [Lentilitoribacter sp. EG35]|uniref:hypothetical protein n=1 Tax=Lentilitoribacter sp. EG35 TaxID=3234192 RepID=UPI003461245D
MININMKPMNLAIIVVSALLVLVSMLGQSIAVEGEKTETTRITLTYRDPQPNSGEAVATKKQRRLEQQENIDLFGTLGSENQNLAADGPEDEISITLEITPHIIHVDNSDLIRFETGIKEVSKWFGDAVRDDRNREVRNEYAISLIRLRNELKRSLTRVEAEELKVTGTLQLDMLNSEFQSVFSHHELLNDPLQKITLIYTPKDPLPNIRIVKLGAAGTTFEPRKVEYDVPFWVEVFYESEPLEPPTEVNFSSLDGPINAPVLRLKEDEFIWRSQAIVLKREEDPFADAADDEPLPHLEPQDNRLIPLIGIVSEEDMGRCLKIWDDWEQFKCLDQATIMPPIDESYLNSEPSPPDFKIELPPPVNNFRIVKDECGHEHYPDQPVDPNDSYANDCMTICEPGKGCKAVIPSGRPPRILSGQQTTIPEVGVVPENTIDNQIANTEQNEITLPNFEKERIGIENLQLPNVTLPDLNGITDPKFNDESILPNTSEANRFGDAISIDQNTLQDVRDEALAPENDTGILLDGNDIQLSNDLLPDLKGIADTPVGINEIIPDGSNSESELSMPSMAPRIELDHSIPELPSMEELGIDESDFKLQQNMDAELDLQLPALNQDEQIQFGINQDNGRTLSAGTPIISNNGEVELGELEGTPLGELITRLGSQSPVIIQLTKDGVQEGDQLAAKAILDAMN